MEAIKTTGHGDEESKKKMRDLETAVENFNIDNNRNKEEVASPSH